jgi:hypothetical protein
VKHDALAARITEDDHVLTLDHVTLTRAVDSVGRLILNGGLGVPRPAGRVEQFQLKVIYPADDPRELPDVYDPGDRFPPALERHIEPNGRFCLWLRELAPYRPFGRPGGLSLLLTRIQEFLELQLAYESRRALGLAEPWPGPAMDHGVAGQHQWLGAQLERLGRVRLGQIVAAADWLPKPTARCPCGSGRLTRDCHQKMIVGMREAWTRDPSGRAAAHQYLEHNRDIQ